MTKGLSLMMLIGSAVSCVAQLKSPDGRYEISYTSAGEAEANVEFKDTKSGKVIHDGFASGYQELKYREVAWSKDSKYVALVSRGTRTTTQLEILHFNEGVVTEVKIPDYVKNILSGEKLHQGGRYSWVSKLRWNGTKLIFRCAGQRQDGSGDPQVDPDNWFHYELTLQPGAKADPSVARLLGLKAVDEAVRIE